MLSGLFGKSYSEGNTGTNLAVPLMLEPVLGNTDIPKGELPRATVAAVHQQIESDLKEAAAKLPDDNGTRAGRLAAYAFLARLYMAQAKYPAAVAAADSVISSGLYNLNANFEDAFNNSANSPEDIFAIQLTSQSNPGTENNGLVTFYGAQPDGRGDVQVNAAHLNIYQDGDARKDFVYEGSSIAGIDGLYTTKWSRLYSVLPVVRLSEMYLTRAEANLQAGTTVGATPLEDVNTVRERSHASTLNAVTAKAIAEERFRELAFEGDKFWTIKRLKMNAGSRPYNDPKLILPIPQREMDVNSKLTQNTGY